MSTNTKWFRWRKTENSPRDRLGWFCDSHCKVIVQYSHARRVCILWGSCFGTFISLSRFTLLNKHQKPTDHKTENLLNDRNYGPKINKRGRIKSYKCRITTVYMHLEDSLERVYHLQMIGNDWTLSDTNHFGVVNVRLRPLTRKFS